ncbi:MAG: glycosyltransferase family 2 protein [Patescibacteria group bacterium]
MDLSIIIVNYKSREKTKFCLDSIFKADLEGVEYEVILIDNNSGDNLEDLNSEYSKLKLIKNDKNLGMGGGNNLGVKNSKGEYVLILNPDTEIKRDSIKKMFEYIKNREDVAIVGPKLLNTDLSLQYSCAYFPRPWTPIFRRTFVGMFFERHLNWFLMKDFSHNEEREVDWLMGSCLFIRAKDFRGFDERYFMYFEDIDICRQAWESGKKVVYYPDSVIIHHHARESANKRWYLDVFKNKLMREHLKSWYKYFKKWGLSRFNNK